MAKTLYDKIWDAHLVPPTPGETPVIYIDRHLVHEVTSPQAFEGLRLSGRKVRRPELTLAVADHNVPTKDRDKGITEPESRAQVETLEQEHHRFRRRIFRHERYPRAGIVHIIGPEQGWTLPGTTIVCGDSHTSHPWRLRRAGLRHRHLGSRACAGDPDPARPASPRTCASP